MWNIKSPTDITLRMTLKEHRGAVWALDVLSETAIISGSMDKTMKVQSCVLYYVQQEMLNIILCRNAL